MRAFIFVVLFFLTFIVLTSNLLGNGNLTYSSPEAAQAAAPVQSTTPTSTQPLVTTIQERPAVKNVNVALVPVTGGCSNPYTIQAGDWLSTIALNCNTTLAAILQANPQIIDPNLIYPDQRIIMPNGALVPVTGGCANPYMIQPGDWLLKITRNCDTTLSAILQANPQIIDPNLIYPDQPLIIQNASTSTTIPVPVTGLVPTSQSKTSLQIKAIHFPPNTLVNIALGPKSAGNSVEASGVTDASGNLTTHISVPISQNSQTPWVVSVTTTSNPPIQVLSQPFYIK